jgi:maltose/moltooligosaccharide transporter
VYDRVIVGSDGSASALYAVARAHEVAAAAEARVVVVSAYSPETVLDRPVQVGGRHLLYGQDAARQAVHESVAELTSDRIREIEQVVVAGEPAEALLEVARRSPASLLVVGNRGLGAEEGEVLGSVPAKIARNAVCDVLIVQTSALHEEP